MKQESELGEIKLPIDNKEVAEVVLDCMYGASYSDQNRSVHSLYFNIAVYIAADYADLLNVRRLAAKKFLDAASGAVSSSNGFDILIAALSKAYQDTPNNDDMLRPVVAEHCVGNAAKLFKHPKFKSMLNETGELATDIAMKFAARDNATGHAPYSSGYVSICSGLR